MDRRAFLTTAVAGGALSWGAEALAAAPLDATVTRLTPETVRLEWSAKAAPASIFVSSDPDAAKAAMRPLMAAQRGGQVEAAAAVAPRPYFLVAAPGGEVRTAERLLPLAGGRNFRDLGGYRTSDGRQVRWGRIYRSGVMSGLTAGDMGYLRSLGVAVICDLRSVRERTSQPNPFLKGGGPQVVAFDYDLASSLDRLTQAQTRDDAVAAFAAAYVDFLDRLTPQYADMFARLVAAEGPLAMNCSAGKDRTGMGSALVLSVLGVPRETVVADYALTQVYTPPGYYLKQMSNPSEPNPALAPETARAFAKLPPEVLQVIMGSDPEVMRRALAQIDRAHGGPVAVAKARFGLDEAKIARLRRTYLA
jgi:protein-tyrosine phosphatase